MPDHLLIIDPQSDFHPGGSLAIPTADDDAGRIEDLIVRSCSSISRITVTLDSHQQYDIGHPSFWKVCGSDASQPPTSPAPFTVVTSADIASGTVTPTDASLTEYCLTYCKSLESGGRYLPIVWPEHCIIGTPGHNVVPSVRAGLQHWVSSQRDAALRAPGAKLHRTVDYVFKGMNPLTEMYSCMSAERPVPDDPSTHFNAALFNSLMAELDADDATSRLLVCGQASSHCVASSVRDIVAKWEEGDWRGVPLDRLILLKDCMSPVPGFESVAEQFFDDMKSKGVSVRNSTELH